MKKKDNAPKRRARKCLPLDSGSRMSDPGSLRLRSGGTRGLLFVILRVDPDTA